MSYIVDLILLFKVLLIWILFDYLNCILLRFYSIIEIMFDLDFTWLFLFDYLELI